MSFLSKKIRQLIELLEKRKLPQDLEQVVHAIEQTSPEPARAQFQKKLRDQLMMKHKTVAAEAKEVSVQQKTAFALPRFKMPKFAFPKMGLSYAASILVLVLIAGVVSYPFIPAPEVQGYTLKKNTRQISYNAPIKIVFTQPMDGGSVEHAFHIDPQIEGNFKWQNNALLFYPKEQFKIGETFNVSLDKTAKSLFQKPLNTEYLEIFEIVGTPKVILFSPTQDSKNIPTDAKMTMHFDRPMTQLTSLDQGVTNAPEVKIEPPVKGKMKWLGTSSLQFIPEKLLNATHYTFTIPKGTVAADGGTTDQDFVYSFDTLQPSLMSMVPNNLDPYNGPDTAVQLIFNQAMDLGKAKSFLHFFKYKGNNDDLGNIGWLNQFDAPQQPPMISTASSLLHLSIPKVLKGELLSPDDVLKNFDAGKWEEVPYDLHTYTVEEFKKDVNYKETDMYKPDIPTEEERKNSFVLKPLQPLTDDSIYMVKVDKNLPPAEGTFTLFGNEGTDFPLIFKTVGEVKLVSVDPAENATNYSGSGVSFRFNQPFTDAPSDEENATFQSKVSIEPKNVDKDTGKEELPRINFGQNQINIGYSFKPSTDYTVTLKGGWKSKFGKVYNQDEVLKFKTAPLAPDLHLVNSGDLSVLDVNKPNVYYIKTTNVNTVNVNFKALNQDEIKELYTSGYTRWDGAPRGPFTSFTKTITKAFNQRIVTKIDFGKELGSSLAPGFYYFDVSSPEVREAESQQQGPDGVWRSVQGNPVMYRELFMVSGTALATKLSNKKLLVWATSMKDGSPVADMDILVKRSLGETEILKGKTDKNGLVSLTLPNPNPGEIYGREFVIVGQKDGDFTMTHSSWMQGVSPWDFALDYSAYIEKYFAYIYTDRPIYRPGNTVYFKGLVRTDEDAKFVLPDRKKTHVTISDPQGEKVFEKDVEINKNGTFSGELTLGPKVRVGYYSIITSLAGPGDDPYAHQFYGNFQVAEYRKPDFKLTLEADKKEYINGDQAKIKVNGAYFFGAPMSKGKVEWTVYGSDYYYSLPSDGVSPYGSQWFSFSEEGYLCYWRCSGETKVISQGRATLDANGEYTIPLALNIGDKKLSQMYSVEVTAYDLNYQSVSNRTNLAVHQGEYYVGIMGQDYVAKTGQDAGFDVITVAPDGQPAKGKSVEISLFKRDWNTIKKKNVDSDFYYENNYEDLLIEKKSVTTDDKGHANVSFKPKDGGMFKVTAQSQDGRGNKILSATTFYASSSSFVNWGRENNDKIELVPDKQEYQVGDTAHILIKSPYQNVYALVTQERAEVMKKEVIKITSNSQIIDVPITEKSLPNIFVSVLLVKGSSTDAGLNDPGKEIDERDVAAFKMGYTTLQVNTSSKKLLVELSSDKTQYHPGDEVTLNVTTKDVNGKGRAAEVSISVVDESVLSLTNNVTADLLTLFYRKRFLSVSTSETLTKALSRLNVQVESGLKGGGGGRSEVRGNFKDTAYWQAALETNSNGDGTLKFTVPDNLTTWQVLAIAITDDTLVGSQKMDFLVRKDVLVRPVLPRFLIINDTLTVEGIVHNYLTVAKDFDVSLKATGVTLNSTISERIHLNPGEEKAVKFPITVQNEQEASFRFDAMDASDPNIGDIVENKIPIHEFSFPEVVATSTVLNNDSKHVETIWLPTGINPKFGELTVTTASTLAGSITKGIEYLVKYPYGCAEQTASSLLPNLAVKQIMDLPAVGNKLIDLKDLQKKVDMGLQALYKYQQSNGGWGIWETSQPTPYLTSYVLYTLNEAKKAGYSVDATVMQRGVDYLRNYIHGKSLEKGSRYDANSRAFALYTMAEMGQGDLGLSNNLYGFKDDLNLFSKAYLVMNFHTLMNQNDVSGSVKTDLQKKIDALKNEILNKAQETPRGVQFTEAYRQYDMFDTDTRTTALVLQMLSRIDMDNPLVEKILRNLLMERKDGHYVSTQETAVSLFALTEYLKASKELEPNYTGIITLNGAEKSSKSYTQKNLTEKDTITISLADLLPNNQDNEVVTVRDGIGKMYVDMNLKYFLPTEKIQPRDEGLVVTQEYFKTDDLKLENPVTGAQVGENLVGKMTVIVPEDRYYVMVEDYLPAGLEGVDFSLSTAQQGLQNQNYGGKGDSICSTWDCGDWNSLWRFNYSEVRDDRMMYFADFLPKGVYEIKYFVRATSVGQFHDLPALGQELYFPEVFGRSAGRNFGVVEEKK